MPKDTTEAELDAAFDGGFDDAQPEETPAADDAAPDSPASPEAPQTDTAAEDELAGLPPKVRAMLDEFQQIKQAVQAVPGLEQRLRKTEGRIGDLNTRLPAPPPPAPPKLEKVERVRAELPEVIEALEEYVGNHVKSQQPAQPQPAADSTETPILAEAFPKWEETVAGDDFAKWLDAEGAEYANRVKSTTSEAVMLQALTRYDEAKKYASRQTAEAAAAAQRVAQTRQSRATAAAVPAGAGRRAPTPSSTLDDAFAEGFSSA